MTRAAVRHISLNDPNDTPISCSSSALSPCKSVLVGENERCPAYSDFCSGDSGAESDGSTDRDADGDTDREGESESTTEHHDDGDGKDGRAEADKSPVKGGGQIGDGGRGRQRDNDASRSVYTVPIQMGRVSGALKHTDRTHR
jgi:hypothetical protein